MGAAWSVLEESSRSHSGAPRGLLIVSRPAASPPPPRQPSPPSPLRGVSGLQTMRLPPRQASQSAGETVAATTRPAPLAITDDAPIASMQLALPALSLVPLEDLRPVEAVALPPEAHPYGRLQRTLELVGFADKVNGGRFASPELVRAAEQGDAAVVERLLSRGADPNSRGACLTLTVDTRSREEHSPVKGGADTTALHVCAANARGGAAAMKIVKSLLAAGAMPSQRSGLAQDTPLHIAAYNGHTEIMDVLVAAGGNVNCRNAWGYTPLGLAALKGEDAAAAQLVRLGADKRLPLPDCGGRTASEVADSAGYPSTSDVITAAFAAKLPSDEVEGVAQGDWLRTRSATSPTGFIWTNPQTGEFRATAPATAGPRVAATMHRRAE